MFLSMDDLGLGQESGGFTNAQYAAMLEFEKQGVPHEEAKARVISGQTPTPRPATTAVARVAQAPAAAPGKKKIPTWLIVLGGAAVATWVVSKCGKPARTRDEGSFETGAFGRGQR